MGLSPSPRSPVGTDSDRIVRLGRQLEDHSRSDREMLRVRIPPEPSRSTPLWSSPECSPLCRSGGRGFKSRRGRWLDRFGVSESFHARPRRGRRPAVPHEDGPPGSTPGPGTRGRTGVLPGLISRERWVRLPCPQCSFVIRHGRQTGKAARSRIWCLWVRLPPVLLRFKRPSRGPTATTPVLQTGNGGSIPSGTTGEAPHGLRPSPRWAAGPTGRRLVCTQEIGVRFPGRSTGSIRGTTEGSRIRLAGPLC